jgi:hypothetical protein
LRQARIHRPNRGPRVVVELLEVDQRSMRSSDCAQQLVQLYLDRFAIPVLSVVDQEDRPSGK